MQKVDISKISTKVAESQEIQKNIRNPQHRLKNMSILLSVFMVVILLVLMVPWYKFSFNQTVTVPGSFEQVQNVVAERTLSGYDLATLETGSSPLQKQIPVGPLGLILPAVWALLAVALGAAAGFMRNGLFSILSVFTLYLAYGSIDTLRQAMEDPTYGGAYNTPGAGIGAFTFVLFLAFALSVVIGIQVMVVNRREREARRAAGEEVRPNLIELAGALKLDNITRVAAKFLEEASDVSENAKKKK